ncbi:MAG: hypothetical protein IJ794_01610 [Lachnospiraceae bacterium]|nr:hypothetical protein [Lachnospiraceae bacterium]
MANESVIVGCTSDNKKVFLCSEEKSNCNIFAVGKSGCGKTTELMSLIVQKAAAGEKILVINYRNCTLGLPTMLANKYASLATVIDVANEGLAVPLFTPQNNADGMKENNASMLERIVKLFKYAVNLSPTQENIFMEAVCATCKQDSYADSGMNVTEEFLKVQNKRVAEQTLCKMRLFFKDNFLRDGDFLTFRKNFLELNLNDLEYDDQMPVVRFLLDYLLRMAYKGRFRESGITIMVDEAQNLDYSENSPVIMLLNESRKHNVRLMFAMPSITESKKSNKALSQCGVCLYFSPSDNDKGEFADLVCNGSVSKAYWTFVLSKLERGKFIATGNVLIDGSVARNPLELNGYVEERHNANLKKSVLNAKTIKCVNDSDNDGAADLSQIEIPFDEEDEGVVLLTDDEENGGV